jgi:hypothetical protein
MENLAEKMLKKLTAQSFQERFRLTLFCHFGKIQRIRVVTAYEKSRFHPGLTKEG